MSFLSYFKPLEIAKVNSPLNGEIKVVESFGKRTLYVNDVEQSGGTIKGMWGKAIKKFSIFNFQFSNCLLLGLGGGTVIRLLNKYYPEAEITAVEIDPVIIDVAEKFFNVKPSNRLKIIHADAFSWIKTTYKKYDLIIFDLFLGKFNPEKSRKLPFLADLKKLLNQSGFILYNAHYQNDEEKYQELLKECRKVFSEVKLLLAYPYSRILFLGN